MANSNEREPVKQLSETARDLVFVISSDAIEGYPLTQVQVQEIIIELGLVDEEKIILNKLTRLNTLKEKNK